MDVGPSIRGSDGGGSCGRVAYGDAAFGVYGDIGLIWEVCGYIGAAN